MKTILVRTIAAFLGAGLAPSPLSAADYVWDNQAGNSLWNDPVNWGLQGNSGYNVAPTAADGAIFLKNFSPNGPVRLGADGFAQYLRQDSTRVQRFISIDPGQTVDRTLTLSGTAAALIDGNETWVDFGLDGTPNGIGARLRLQLNGSGTSVGTRVNKAVTLRISCDVSGAGGFNLTGGLDGAGRLLLSGNNTYAGPTLANSGVLLVNGQTAAASPVTVNAGGILAGIGTINGPVSINPGGLVSPGANSQAPLLGTLAVQNNFTLAGDLQIEINKSFSPSNDMVLASGTLTNAGAGAVHVLNYGAVLEAGDNFKLFNQPLRNGQALKILSAGREIWTNKLAVDGSIEVLSASNAPLTGNPTNVFTWKGAVVTSPPWKTPMQTAANWVENQAPAPGSSNILVFQGDILVPYNWPFVDTNYGTTILIFSNNTALNSIKILAGSNHVMNLGAYVRQDTAQPCYFGITGPVPVKGTDGVMYTVNNAWFTNALGDASCGSQTEFQCTGGRLDVYGVLTDGAGTSSRLVKSGPYTLNLTGNLDLGNDPNSYTGGTLVNNGVIKLAKKAGVPCLPGDVTVNGTGALQINVAGGEQIADHAIVTLNHSGRLDLAGQPETVQTVQGNSAGASVALGNGTLTVSPWATNTYNGGPGVSSFAGAVSGGGTLIKNGTGTYELLGTNSVANLVVNAGTLKINGHSGAGTVTINPGATLLAQGSLAAPVTVAGGGTIGAGFSAGQATFASGLNLGAAGNGATNLWELAALADDATGAAGADFDQIVLTGGTLTLGPSANLHLRFIGAAAAPDIGEPFWQQPHTWRIVSLNGGANPGLSNFGRIPNGSYAAGNFTTTADATGILLTYTPTLAPPRITAILGAGTATVAVHYTNTLPGTNYILACATNLNSPNWFTVGSKIAPDTSDFQSDHPAAGGQRYYRVYYVMP
jgi:fibronectin-binding autotransporter adhesin